MRRTALGTAALAAAIAAAMIGAPSAQGYQSLGCRWASSSVRFYVPSPLVSYPTWWQAAASWNGLQARFVSSSVADVTGTNVSLGNMVAWTGVTRAKGTLQSIPPCSSGRWVPGRMEVVINWSKVTTLGYSSAQRKMVAAHELGHAFGLAHNPSNRAVLMYPTDARTVLVPQSDDKAGVNAIY
jgi:predicted Zn-dependent protease